MTSRSNQKRHGLAVFIRKYRSLRLDFLNRSDRDISLYAYFHSKDPWSNFIVPVAARYLRMKNMATVGNWNLICYTIAERVSANPGRTFEAIRIASERSKKAIRFSDSGWPTPVYPPSCYSIPRLERYKAYLEAKKEKQRHLNYTRYYRAYWVSRELRSEIKQLERMLNGKEHNEANPSSTGRGNAAVHGRQS